MEVYTSKGWVLRENPDHLLHEADVCCDCDKPANWVTNAGPDLLWAHCDGCALEFNLAEGYNAKKDGIEASDLDTVEVFDLDII